MGFLKDIIIRHSIEIKTTPEKIFDFFAHLEKKYKTWHPDAHVVFRWIKGKPWEEGSILYAEEYLHGKLHKLKFRITKVVPNREIEYVPLFWLLRIYFPKNTFTIEPKGENCIFTATCSIRVGWLFKKLAKNKLEFGIECVKKHMKEEGENLKRLLENQND